MAKKAKENKDEGVEILENPDALVEQYDKVEGFIKQNQAYVYGVIGFIVIGIAGYFYWQNANNEAYQEAEVEIYEAEYVFEGDSAFQAEADLSYIVETYPGTKTANRALFELGVISLRKGDHESAIEYLEEFSSKDYLIQSRAYSLIGDAHVDLEHYDEAADAFQKAVDNHANQYYTPVYLMKLGAVHEIREDYEAAINAYNQVIQEYATSYNEVNNAKKQKAFLEAKNSKK